MGVIKQMDDECDRDPILPRLPLPECYLVVGKVEQVRKKRLHRSLKKRIGDYSITFYVLKKTHIPAARFILTYDFTDFLTTILRGVIIVNIIDDYPD